ncbi:MAG: hypothetical protein QGG42_20455 [Phycisphaerae bacterium]|jgi:hypothetical protein|nr:hypothetical protein [Phycisphaerae bacterium]
MKRYLISAIVVAAAVAGCDETIYRIKLTPKDDKLVRTLTVTRQGGSQDSKRAAKPLPDAELAEIAKAYSQDKPKGPIDEPTFTGAFANVMPNDVGGSGRFVRGESRMGVASSYIERFRGNDRPGEVIEASLKALDELMDIFIGYMETRLGAEAAFPKLRKFMDTELRKDIKNLCTYAYLGSSTSQLNWLDAKKHDKNTLGYEILARVAAYLIEREYIEPADLPFLRRVTSDQLQADKLLNKALARIAAKAKITDAKFIARLGSLLTDQDKTEASFEAYLRTTSQYKKAVKELKPPVGDEKKEAQARDIVMKPLLEKAVPLRIDLGLGNTQRVEIELVLPAKPTYTNGKWNPKSGAVTWKGPLTKRREKTPFLPEICYALWSKPNEKFQKARFGKVFLSGDRLMNYCLWRRGLAADEAKHWDAVLLKHKPGQDLEASIKTSDKPMPYLLEGLKLLQQAMKRKDPDRSED